MENFTILPPQVATWVAIIGIDIAGIFAIASLFDKQRRERNKLLTEETNQLISVLKSRVDNLEDEVKLAKTEAQEARINYEKMKTENATFRDVLQGRDGAMVEYMKAGVQAMQLVKDTHGVVIESNGHVKEILKSINRLATVMEKQVDSK